MLFRNTVFTLVWEGNSVPLIQILIQAPQRQVLLSGGWHPAWLHWPARGKGCGIRYELEREYDREDKCNNRSPSNDKLTLVIFIFSPYLYMSLFY